MSSTTSSSQRSQKKKPPRLAPRVSHFLELKPGDVKDRKERGAEGGEHAAGRGREGANFTVQKKR